jgi:hypothetical protein
MKKAASFGRALFLCLSLVMFSATFTLSGCTVDSLSGPDLPAHTEQNGGNNGGGTSSGGDHNEGTNKTENGGNNGGGTSSGGDHNED